MSSKKPTMTALEYAAASINEENIQAAIIHYCKVKKIQYLQTSRRGVTCHTCKKRVYGGDGASKGLPDLFIWLPRLGLARWIGVEVKGPKTPLSPEQKTLLEAGAIFVVRSLDEFINMLIGESE